MVIIECKANLKEQQFARLTENLQSQVKTGAVVLPYFCDLVAITTPEQNRLTVVKDAPTYSLRKNGVVCSTSELLYCGYSREEIKELQAAGFELYAGNIKLEL